MDKHEIDEALNEAYKRGWEDAFLLFKKNYNIVQGLDNAHEFTKPQNATAKWWITLFIYATERPVSLIKWSLNLIA